MLLTAMSLGFSPPTLSPHAVARRAPGSQVKTSVMIDQNIFAGGTIALLSTLVGVVRAPRAPLPS